MSLAQETPTTARCAYCDGERNPFDSVEGSFCSKLCYYKHTGQKLLNTVQHDHRWCTNCGRRLKEVEPPTQEQLKQINGYHSTKALEDGGGIQYRTPNADIGEICLDTKTSERITTGTICRKCGNTSHNTEFPEDRNRHLLEYGSRILDTLGEKHDEHNKTIEEDTFFEMLITTEDLVFSLGKAIEQQ